VSCVSAQRDALRSVWAAAKRVRDEWAHWQRQSAGASQQAGSLLGGCKWSCKWALEVVDLQEVDLGPLVCILVQFCHGKCSPLAAEAPLIRLGPILQQRPLERLVLKSQQALHGRQFGRKQLGLHLALELS